MENNIITKEDIGLFKISKRIEIAGSHCLNLPYQSPCNNIHGHNWIITIHCKGKEKDLVNDMLIDFKRIKDVVMEFDHSNLNEKVTFRPTAERLAQYLVNNILFCYKAEVQESEGNIASYEL